MYIKNFYELTRNRILKKERCFILKLLDESISFSNPENVIKRNVKFEDGILRIMNVRIDVKNKNIFVIGFGKASVGMAKGIRDILKKNVKKFIIISPVEYKGKDFEFYRSSHPYPNMNSVIGTRRIISLIRGLKEEDIVIFLISGGGSSSLVLPEKGISLYEKIKISKKLIESGADIYEINTVRKLLSGVKGGKLAKMCPANIINLIISDVVGDRIDIIGSGPTVEDKTNPDYAYEILKKYDILKDFPNIKKLLKKRKNETFKLRNVNNFLLLRNIDVLRYIEKISNVNSIILTSRMKGSPDKVGSFLSSIAEEVFYNDKPIKKPGLIISGGESEVKTINGKGRGGPNEELCLYFLLNISKDAKFVFTSIDSDGKDGSSNYAGAIVDTYSFQTIEKKAILYSLNSHNSEEILRKEKELIYTEATGTNVNDLQLCYIF